MKESIKKYYNNPKLLRYIKGIKKIPWIFGRDAFLFILIFVLLDLLFGEYVFYTYVINSKSNDTPTTDLTVNFKENLYQTVLQEMENRKAIFEGPVQENQKNPFLPSIIVPSTPENTEQSTQNQ